MDFDNSFSIDILGIISLVFTIYIAFRNIVIDNLKTKLYIIASITTISLMVLEIVTIIFQSLNSVSGNLIVLYKLTNVAGFSLSPFVPYILLLISRKKTYYHNKFLLIPLFFNILICIFSYSTGWVFLVNDQNQYMRGDLFLIPTIISMFYYVLLLASINKQDFKFDFGDKIHLALVFLMPIIAMVIQILFHEIILIWGTISISLLLYYIFLRELEFKYDTMCEVKNRAAFKKELEQIQKKEISVVFVVLDLNDLKKINDCYGHKAGDNALYSVAKVLKESFDEIGEPYRIGGDEFCVICKNTTKQSVDNALLKLEYLTDMESKNQNFKIVIAYGYDFYKSNQNKSIYDIYSNADKSMYEHKTKLKAMNDRTEG